MELNRRKARIIALEVLYEIDISNGDRTTHTKDFRGAHPNDGSGVNSIINTQLAKKNLPKSIKDFILKLIEGILEHRDEIDKQIVSNTDNWSLDRITVIDRNILRLASFELLYCGDVPFKVAIDEAVELGKLYGTEESGAFINGILDKMVRGIALRKDEVNKTVLT